MATKKKMLQAAAGNAGGGAGPDVEDVFSTYLFTGNDSTQTITNGIDLAGEGGIAWFKSRNPASDHNIYMTDLGNTSRIIPNENVGLLTGEGGLSSFNSDGFSLDANSNTNGLNRPMVSWTFRKAPKFFDVVTYTGDGTNPRTISHNLDAEVGMMVIKRLDTTSNWHVYHRSWSGYGEMNLPNPFSAYAGLWPSAPTSTTFTLDDNAVTNASGSTYVAYLFAHNDGDGEFGPDADADIIKCGSYTGNGSDQEIDLGFEPQWILIKPATFTHDWYIWDTMRGFKTYSGTDTNNLNLKPNTNDAESDFDGIALTSTGFSLHGASNAANSSGQTYIYMAIRRDTKVPESATEAFDVQTFTGNGLTNRKITTGFTVDANITWGRDGKSACLAPRLIDGMHETNSTGVPYDPLTNWIDDDYNDGFIYPTAYTFSNDTNTPYVSYSWKRAPGYFDVVAYTGDGSSGSYAHNLGVVPELKIIKNRSGQFWVVGGSVVTGGTRDNYIVLNTSDAIVSSGNYWGSVDSATTFSVRPGNGASNQSGADYIAYLFASLPGISKVGSYVGNGTSQTIDCGFTSGARFVLIKKTSNTGHWIVFDTERGIVSGIDPFLKLNTTDAENTGHDAIDPDSSGFIINESGGAFNVNNENYIFYAIA